MTADDLSPSLTLVLPPGTVSADGLTYTLADGTTKTRGEIRRLIVAECCRWLDIELLTFLDDGDNVHVHVQCELGERTFASSGRDSLTFQAFGERIYRTLVDWTKP